MGTVAQGQFTIIDMNDPIVSGAEPSDKVDGMLWLDTSKEPNELKRWDEEKQQWIIVSDSGIVEDLEQIIKKTESYDIQLKPSNITATVEANTTILASKEFVGDNYTSKEYALSNLANKSELEILSNNINAKVSQEEYNATIDGITGELTGFDGRLNQAEIDLKPENITMTVEENTTKLVDKGELAGSEEKAIEEVNSKIAQISVSLDAINQRVEHTETGSKNYIKNSGEFKDTRNWMGNISVVGESLSCTGEVKNATSIPLEKGAYYVYSATVLMPARYSLTENNLLNYSIEKKVSSRNEGFSGMNIRSNQKGGLKNFDLLTTDDLVVQIEGDSFNIYEGSTIGVEFKSNKELNDVELSINDGETYEYIGSIAGNKINFDISDLKTGMYVCNIKASTSSEIFVTQSFLIRIENMVVFDDVFEVIEILGTKDILANEYTRVYIRLRARVDLEESYLNAVVKPNHSNNYLIKNIQFEKGSVPSDWVNADELDEVRKQLAEISIGINEITSSVSNIQTLTNKLGNIEERVQRAEQKITASSITNTVQETITIGSKNYVRNSGDFKDKSFWTGNITVANGNLTCNGNVINTTNIPIEKGNTYVLSATLKLPANFSMTENNLLDCTIIKTYGGEIDG